MLPVLFALAAAQAISAAKQADEIRMQAELQANLNEVNAKYAEHDAYEAYKFGETEVARYEPQIDETVGAQRAVMASQGVDVSYGTGAELQQQTRLTGTLNILDIQNQARMKAEGYSAQARNIRQSSSVQKSKSEIAANDTEVSGIINAGATGYRGYTQLGPNNPNTLGTSNKTGRGF